MRPRPIWTMITMNCCHNIVVFVPGCLLCPCLQAGGKKTNDSWPEAFEAVWRRYPVGRIQMPCPETLFSSETTGLRRAPHGVQYYEALDGFGAFCDALAQQTAGQIVSFQKAGYFVAAVLGIEHSPTCAVHYMYTHQGMMRRSGLYLDALRRALAAAGTEVPMIGINRKFPRKASGALESAVLTACRMCDETKRDVMGDGEAGNQAQNIQWQ